MLSQLFWEDILLIYKALYMNHVASKATHPSQKLLGNILIPPHTFFAMPCSMQDLSSPARDQTCVPCIGSTES